MQAYILQVLVQINIYIHAITIYMYFITGSNAGVGPSGGHFVWRARILDSSYSFLSLSVRWLTMQSNHCLFVAACFSNAILQQASRIQPVGAPFLMTMLHTWMRRSFSCGVHTVPLTEPTRQTAAATTTTRSSVAFPGDILVLAALGLDVVIDQLINC